MPRSKRFLKSFVILIFVAVASWLVPSKVLGATINVSTGSDPIANATALQNAINSATCGSTIVLPAGAVFDGSYTLPNDNCTQSTPITITSSAASQLPNGRVSPSDAVNMPTLRSLGTGYGAIFVTATNAGWWVLDGLSLTDNAGQGNIAWLLDYGDTNLGAHDLTVQRCYFHQKETGTNYNRSIMRAIGFEGTNLMMKWNYAYIVGYYYPQYVGGNAYTPMTTEFLLTQEASGITLDDNYISVWYNGIFTGGGDNPPQNTATLTGASTSSAVFSNTTGLTPGLIVRFDLDGTGTVSGGVLTSTGGPSLAAVDYNRTFKVFSVATGLSYETNLGNVSGNVYSGTGWFGGGVPPDGNYTWSLYEAAQINSVSGNTVTFTPLGPDTLSHPAQAAAWNVGDQGQVNDIVLEGNTFYIDPGYANAVYTGPNPSFPKGYFEIKNANRMTVEGNQFLGFPAALVFTPRNQDGSAPWSTDSHLIIANNLIAPDYYYHAGQAAMVLHGSDEYHTITAMADVQIYNNLIKNVGDFMQINGGSGFSIYHNTVFDDSVITNTYGSILTNAGYPDLGMNFRDNILAYANYGILCFNNISPLLSYCWPSGQFANNVVIDSENKGVTTSEWGPGAILSPIAANSSTVGFTDLVNGNYRLTASSPYKNMASDGTDPGINQDTLEAALGGQVTTPPPPPPPDTTPPSIPTGLAATPISSFAINLSWTASTDNVAVTGYKVYRNSTMVGTSASPNFSDTGLSASTTYSYTVSAYDAAGNNSAPSTPLSATTLATITPPIILAISAGSPGQTTATITWTTDKTSTSQVNYGTTSAYGQATAVNNSLVTSHSASLSGLSAGTTYHFQVVSVDASGNQSVSSDHTFTTQAASSGGSGGGSGGGGSVPTKVSLTAPTGLIATPISASSISLTWSPSTGATITGYRIWRSGYYLGYAPSTSFTDTNLAPNTTYSYSISAYDAASDVSPQSAAVSGTTLARSQTPVTPPVTAPVVYPKPSTPTVPSSPTGTGSTPSSVTVGSLTANLSYGSSGSQVASLQKFLAQYPSIYPSGLVTGFFGNLTRQAIINFQAGYGIATSIEYGIVGPVTRAKINAIIASGSLAGTISPTAGQATLEAELQADLALLQKLEQLLAQLQGK